MTTRPQASTTTDWLDLSDRVAHRYGIDRRDVDWVRITRLPITAGIWIATSTSLPPAGQPVLVTLCTPKPCVILAQYAPAKTLLMHPECDDESCDYDEERDEYYAAEGWYQCYAVNGALDDEPFWRLHDKVSHWLHCPDPAEETTPRRLPP